MLLAYPNTHRILVAVDCIIVGFDGEELKLLLVKRNFDPEMGKWSLMGGFLEEYEDIDIAARRILYELTGLNDIYMEELQTYGKVGRDPVERTISVCYFSLINIHDHNPDSAKAQNASWISLKNKPNLIFDHNEMVSMAMQTLQYKAALHPIGFELLPERFTIPQLHKLYEAIYDNSLDRRNFSRKILSTGLLINTGQKDENSSTKKGIEYKLDKEKYQKHLNSFLNFVPDPSISL